MAKKGTRDRERIGRGGQFVAPPPRGVRLAAPIPKSVPYEAPDPDPNEEAAFTGLTDTGRPNRNTKRRKGDEGAGMTAAQMRMQGRKLPGEEDGNLDFEHDEDDEDDDTDDGATEEVTIHRPIVQPTSGPVSPVTHPVSPFRTAPGAMATAAPFDGTIHSDSIEGLFCRPVTLEDVDRLWDWIRGDKDYGQAFLGKQFRTSLLLHQFMQQINAAEKQDIALIRSIYHHEHHLGFAMLAPIMAAEKTALMHIYLQPAVRGELAQFAAPLVEIARKTAPGVHLAVASENEAFARIHRQILKPLGFREHVMFIL